jgi:hypothetical protein
MLEGSLICEGRKVSGYCIHPMATYHSKEWPTVRLYLQPYLERAAPTIAGKQFLIDHNRTLSPENRLTLGRWDPEKNAVYYEGEVSDDVAQKIRAGLIKSVSVGLDFQRPGSGILVTEEGTIPFCFGFEEISFLQNMSPGDPQASLQLWEGVLKDAKDGKIPWHVEMSEDAEIGMLADQIYNAAKAKALENLEKVRVWDELEERRKAIAEAERQIKAKREQKPPKVTEQRGVLKRMRELTNK